MTDFIPMTFLKRSLFTLDIQEETTWIVKTTTAHPRYFLLGFKNKTTNTASYTVNNGSFDNVKITDIHVDLNGSLYPKVPMKANFATKQVSDIFNAYINFCLKNGVEPSMTLNEFINFYTIYIIDCSAQAESLRTNSILVKVEIKRESGSPDCRGFLLLLEDDDRNGVLINQGVMSEYR
jgi:hypothetical protein